LLLLFLAGCATPALTPASTPPDPATCRQSTIKFGFFTNWGGFLQETLIFEQAVPHKLIKSDRTELVAYDCGVMF